MAKCGWTRVIVEKPFGRDSETSEKLSRHLGALFSETQVSLNHPCFIILHFHMHAVWNLCPKEVDFLLRPNQIMQLKVVKNVDSILEIEEKFLLYHRTNVVNRYYSSWSYKILQSLSILALQNRSLPWERNSPESYHSSFRKSYF